MAPERTAKMLFDTPVYILEFMGGQFPVSGDALATEPVQETLWEEMDTYCG